jgi:hypothetical protein
MRTIDSALATHLASRTGIEAHVLAWVEAVDKVTGAASPFGIWTGDDDRDFTIDAVSRTYLGAGSLMDVGDLVSETGYVVRVTRMTLAHLAPDIAAILAARSVRLVPCTWHQAHLVPGSHDLVAPPRKVFKGWVERITLPDAAQGGSAAAEIELVSYARAMTRPLTLTKSDEALKRRFPGDEFRKYIAVSGKISTSWGERRGKSDEK